MLTRFTSRKFLLATATFVAVILGTAGIIDIDAQAQVAGFIAAGLYIVVEGFIDLRK